MGGLREVDLEGKDGRVTGGARCRGWNVRGGYRGWGANQCRKPKKWEKPVGRCWMSQMIRLIGLAGTVGPVLPLLLEGPGRGSASFSSPVPSLGLPQGHRSDPWPAWVQP